MKATVDVSIRALVDGLLTGIFVILVGIAVGHVLFRMGRISDEAAAWYGLNFFVPALIVGAVVFLYRFRRLRKRLNKVNE